MRHSLPLATALLAALLAAHPAMAAEPPSHVRALNAEARDVLAKATARSSIVRTLLNTLGTTDVVVYLAVEPLPSHDSTGYLSFHSTGGGVRYVVVRLDSFLATRNRIATLGHELQHALEVAAAPEVRDLQTFALLYRRIGWASGPNKWETDAARAVGEQVLGELVGFRPANLHPLPVPR